MTNYRDKNLAYQAFNLEIKSIFSAQAI